MVSCVDGNYYYILNEIWTIKILKFIRDLVVWKTTITRIRMSDIHTLTRALHNIYTADCMEI